MLVLQLLQLLTVIKHANTINKSCILTGHYFRSLYAVYFRDVNVITVKILDAYNAEQDLDYFADALAATIANKTRKRSLLWQKYQIKTNLTFRLNWRNPANLGIPSIHQVNLAKGTYKQTSAKIKAHSRDKAFAYIILVWNADNLNMALDQNIDVVQYNRGLYLVVFIEENNNYFEVFQRFWNNYKAFNVMATTLCYLPSSNNVFIYNPFKRVGTKYGYVKNMSIDDILDNPNELFDFMNDFNGFPIKISLFPRPPTALEDIPWLLRDNRIYYPLQSKSDGFGGVDGCVVAFLAQKLNFTTVRSQPNELLNMFGAVLESGIATGSLGEVVDGSVDISANGRFMVPYKTNSIEFTHPVMNDKVCPVVPKAQRVPQWLMIFHGFKMETWVFIACVGVICCLFWYLTQLAHNRCINNRKKSKNTVGKHQKTSFSKACIDVIAVILNMPVRLPNSLSQRIFMASLLALNVIIMGIFQGTLVRSFSIVSYYADVNTLEELDKSGLGIATSLQVFAYDTSDLIKRLSSKVVAINSSAMAMAAYRRNVAAMERQQDADFLIRTNYMKNEHSLLHVAHECPSSYFITYIVPKNSPFLPKFNAIILEFFEAGLVNKWYEDFVEAYILEKGWLQPDDSDRKPFTFQDMQAAFFVLIFGVLVSSCVFIAELVYARFFEVTKLQPFLH